MIENRILVVDDQETQIEVLRDQLRDYDFHVVGFTNPDKVIPHLHSENQYSLLIIDVNLGPRTDGIDLAEQVRRDFGHKPILFISGDASKETRARIRRFSLSGGVDFLEKGSYAPEDLFHIVVALVRETTMKVAIDELKDGVSGLKTEFSGVRGDLSTFLNEMRSQKPVTTKACSAQKDEILESQEKMAKDLRKMIFGVATSRSAAVVDAAMTPEKLASKVEVALRPAVAFSKATTAPAARVYLWSFGIIFVGLLTWWTTMWNKADYADDRTRVLEHKHQQIITTIKEQRAVIDNTSKGLSDIKKILLSSPRHPWTTNP